MERAFALNCYSNRIRHLRASLIAEVSRRLSKIRDLTGFQRETFDRAGRHANDDGAWRHVFGDNGARAHYRSMANSDIRQDDSACANPNAILNHNWAYFCPENLVNLS